MRHLLRCSPLVRGFFLCGCGCCRIGSFLYVNARFIWMVTGICSNCGLGLSFMWSRTVCSRIKTPLSCASDLNYRRTLAPLCLWCFYRVEALPSMGDTIKLTLKWIACIFLLKVWNPLSWISNGLSEFSAFYILSDL